MISQEILDRWTEFHYKAVMQLFGQPTDDEFTEDDKISFLEMLGDSEPATWKFAEEMCEVIISQGYDATPETVFEELAGKIA